MKALKKDEKNLEAANNPAALYITLRENYVMRLEYLTRATNVESAPAYTLDTLGVLHLRLGDKERAKEILVQAC